MTNAIDVETAREWFGEDGEVVFLDIREEGLPAQIAADGLSKFQPVSP